MSSRTPAIRNTSPLRQRDDARTVDSAKSGIGPDVGADIDGVSNERCGCEVAMAEGGDAPRLGLGVVDGAHATAAMTTIPPRIRRTHVSPSSRHRRCLHPTFGSNCCFMAVGGGGERVEDTVTFKGDRSLSTSGLSHVRCRLQGLAFQPGWHKQRRAPVRVPVLPQACRRHQRTGNVGQRTQVGSHDGPDIREIVVAPCRLHQLGWNRSARRRVRRGDRAGPSVRGSGTRAGPSGVLSFSNQGRR